jgi:hypothetical protein
MARAFLATSTQKLEVANPVLGATAFACTFHCWFQPTTAADNATLMMSLTAGTLNWRQLGLRSSDAKLGAHERQTDGTSGFATSTGVLSDGVWAACGAVFTTAASRTVYLNGVADTDTTAIVLADTFDKFRIGGEANYATGNIAEAAVWNVALNAGEMTALAKGFCPVLIRPSALVAYWPLFANDATELDMWKNGYALTVTGATKAAHPGILYPTGAF